MPDNTNSSFHFVIKGVYISLNDCLWYAHYCKGFRLMKWPWSQRSTSHLLKTCLWLLIPIHLYFFEKGMHKNKGWIKRKVLPSCIAQSVTCLTADPGVTSLIPVWSNTFVEIDHELYSTAIILPFADSNWLL